MTKTYITATSLRSASGATQDSIYDVFNKKSALCVYDDIIHEKKICIGKFKKDFTFNELLIQSVQEVLGASNLKDFSSTLLLVGSSVGGMATTEKILFKENNYEKINPQKHSINVIASTLDNQFNFLANRSYSTACTSSANALKTAKDLISLKAYENILIIGADEICSTTIFGFSSLGILSDEICTPFKQDRKGMNVAEGIGVLLLQNKPNKNSIELCGAGASSDAYHIANPDPTSAGAISAIKKALIDANIDASQINYINAHGTGTQANDESEANAIIDIFGTDVAVSSSKSNLGHTLGAAGAIEAIICAEALKRQIFPPQLDCTQKEKEINLVAEPKESKINYVLSNSFAFGGNNVSLVFGVYNEN